MRKYIILILLYLFNFGYSQDGCWFSSLFKDFDKLTPEYKAFFNANSDAMYAYEQLYKAGRTGLKQNKKALEAFITAKNNAKLKELGFTDELLAKVNGYNPASYDEILTDLNKLGDFLTQNNIKLENFQSTIGILVGNNANYRQGVHWIIQDVGIEIAFANKTLTLEVSINNARETLSSIDLVCNACANGRNINIEYKSGPGSIKSETIKKQFIERDLFNANSLAEIQWRMKNTNLTKEKLVEWLIEHKSSLNNPKARKLFEDFGKQKQANLSIDDTDDLIDFFKKNDEWYNLIFK
ncbi:hypothetical protein V3470_00010 [Flavobacterium oreochromis]|uniref:Uncharacterized protein n=1 Tax=Flavobacterium oreochromis TaxID=2906078 RepID=A0ABW8P6H8_9FLAO